MGQRQEFNIAAMPRTKQQAIAGGVRHFYTGEPCRNGHVCARVAHQNYSKCVECLRAGSRRGQRIYVHAHRETVLAKAREYQSSLRATGRDWGANNPHRHAAMKSEWKSNNPAKVRASAMKRKAAQLQATPPWLSADHLKQIELTYARAVERSRDGVPHEVDHIVPLQGRTVCGLHVPWNLRVITAVENNRRPRIWDASAGEAQCL